MWSGTSKPEESLRKKIKEREGRRNEEDSLYLKWSYAILPISVCTGILNQISLHTAPPQIFGFIPGIYYVLKYLQAENTLPAITFLCPQGMSILLALGEYMQENSVVEWLNAAFIWYLRTVKVWTSLKEFEKTGIRHWAYCISIYYIWQVKHTHRVTVITLG